MDHAAAAIAEFLNLAKILPAGTFIAVPANVTDAVIEAYKVAHSNKRGAASLVKHTCDLMIPLVRAAASHSKEELGDVLTDELDSLPKLLTEVQEGMLQITGRGSFAGVFKRGGDKRLIEDLNTKLRQRLQTFEVKGLLSTQIRLNVNEQARRGDHVRSQAALERNRAEMHARLDQLQVTQAVVTRARPQPLLRTVSRHFTGRNALIAQAVAAIADSSHPHISFFGTGGVGKTSMALAVAHHETCVQQFCEYRYFVECEALTSASAVRTSILQVLAGTSKVPTEGNPRQLLASMLSVDHLVLLILDNFETPWNTSGQRAELTELLKEMAAIPNVRMITTLRGDDAPASADVAWTRLPVRVLTLDDARDVFLSINPSTSRADHGDLDLLLKAVDCLPLAVKLLAEVKKHQTCSELLQRWQETQTSLINTERQGGTRLTSLDVSISLSLYSPLLDDTARSLLATICQLPAGVIGGRSKLKAMDLGVSDVNGKLDALLEVALLTDDRPTDRITMPPPIRAYVSAQTFDSYEEQLEMYYITQIERWDELSMGDAGYVGRQNALVAEMDNIRYFFQHRMIYHPSLKLGKGVFTFTHLEWHARPSTQLIACLSNQLIRIGWEEHRPHCGLRLGDVYIRLGKYAEAEDTLHAAQAQFVAIGDKLGAAQCLRSSGEAHRMLNKYADAEDALQAARAQFVEIGNRRGAAECLRGMGNVQRLLSQYTEAESTLQAARAQFVEIGDRLGAADCLRSLGTAQKMLYKYTEAENAIQAARAQFLGMGHIRGVAQCLYSLGEVYRMLGKNAEAEDVLQAALAQFVEMGHRSGAAQCLQQLGAVRRMLSRYTEAEDALQAARAQFVEIGDRLGAAYCLLMLGDVYSMHNKYAEAVHVVKAAWAQFVEIGHILGVSLCLQILGDVHTMLNKYAEAEAELQAARVQFVEIGHKLGAAECLFCLGKVHRMLSKYVEAENELQSARAHFVEIRERYGAAQCLRSMGEVHSMLGKYAEAEDELQSARAQSVEIEDRHGAAVCLRSLGDLHRMLDRLAQAEDALQAAQAELVEIGDRLGAAWCKWILAEVFRCQQRWQEAETLLAEAELVASSIGDRNGHGWICRYRGRLYKGQGRHEEARAECARSRDYFLSIGHIIDAEDVMREAED